MGNGLNGGWIYRNRVSPALAGLTLLEFYARHYRHSSRQQWCDRICQGQILLDGAAAAPDTVLQPGQRLSYHRPPWREPAVPLEFEVLYDDGDVVAIAKPSGLPVLPGGGFLEHTLLHQLRRRFPSSPPAPVHRLGRGTSGVLLAARSAEAKAHLSRQWRRATAGAPQLVKTYRALVADWTLPDPFTLTTPIGLCPHPLGQVHGASPHGKPAHSQGRVLQRRRDGVLLEVTIRTGRPHQIRIHLAAAGQPLLGDPLYGVGGQPRAEAVPGDVGYALHAHRLRCVHPCSSAALELVAPPPPLLQLPPPHGLALAAANQHASGNQPEGQQPAGQ